MPEAARSIFNKRAVQKLRNPDDLDKYVRVTSPTVWAIVGALVALLLGLLAWGVFGTVSTNVTATGSYVNGQAMCFLPAEDAAKVSEGDAANVGGVQASVDKVSAVPLSRDEAHAKLGSDYLVSSLVKADWAYLVTFKTEDAPNFSEGVPLTVNIVTKREAPLALLLG